MIVQVFLSVVQQLVGHYVFLTLCDKRHLSQGLCRRPHNTVAYHNACAPSFRARLAACFACQMVSLPFLKLLSFLPPVISLLPQSRLHALSHQTDGAIVYSLLLPRQVLGNRWRSDY